jgi:uncharacterized protein involved in type VI secretion and phage assembly
MTLDPVNQKDRLLRIETVLDAVEKDLPGDPLLLVRFDADEGISMPYRYDVVLYRQTDKNKERPLVPSMLVGTRAVIHVRGEDDGCNDERNLQLIREGVFISLVTMDTAFPQHFIRFAARLVAPFKLLDYEVGYRVFENDTVDNILESVLELGLGEPAPAIPAKTMDFSLIENNPKLPTLEYCVQFNESTFNFASRLMREYGIWYYFSTRKDGDVEIDNGTMKFGVGPFPENALRARQERIRSQSAFGLDVKMRIDKDPPAFAVDIPVLDKGTNPGWTISNWMRRTYAPNFLDLNIGNFNIVHPTLPIDRTNKITKKLNPLNPNGSYDRSRYRHQIFPTPTWSSEPTSASGGSQFEDADTYAKIRRIEDNATMFFSTGISKNPTFTPGLYFDIDADLTNRDQIDNTFITFLVLSVHTTAYEMGYAHTGFLPVLRDISNNLFGDDKTPADIVTSYVSAGLNQWLQNYINPEQDIFFLNKNAPNRWDSFNDYFAAGFLSNATSLLPGIMKNISELLGDHNGFANSITCTQEFTEIPLPVGTKPVAFGPHLAVVIGQDGIDTNGLNQKGELYADALGRVRVRFPWDRKLTEESVDGRFPQFKRGDTTCWLRVSEGWAGRHFGTQFLPRIGQEVIVSFIDGDPDRPIITGRVYNADNSDSTPNLPFPDPATAQTAVTQKGLLQEGEQEGARPHGSPNFRFTGIKTQSTGAPGQPPPSRFVQEKRYHLLRLDDTVNCEQYLIRSQGRLDVTAFASSFETTYGNKNVKVVQGKLPNGQPVGGNMYTTVEGEYDLHVGGNRYEQVDKDYELTVKGNVRADLQGNLTAVVKGDVSVGLDSLVIEAFKKITLKVGQSFIVIDPCEIWISAPAFIHLNDGGSADKSADVTMQNVADATPAEPGDEWYKRTTDCTDQPKTHGQRSTHTEQVNHSPDCSQIHDGISCNFLGDEPEPNFSPAPPPLTC